MWKTEAWLTGNSCVIAKRISKLASVSLFKNYFLSKKLLNRDFCRLSFWTALFQWTLPSYWVRNLSHVCLKTSDICDEKCRHKTQRSLGEKTLGGGCNFFESSESAVQGHLCRSSWTEHHSDPLTEDWDERFLRDQSLLGAQVTVSQQAAISWSKVPVIIIEYTERRVMIACSQDEDVVDFDVK